MAYNEKLANRVRELLQNKKRVEKKKMMGGLTFMVNDKMSVGVLNDDLMVRIDPDVCEDALERKGCHQMDFTGRPMKGFVFVEPDGIKSKKYLEYWLSLALEYNKKAKSSKRKK